MCIIEIIGYSQENKLLYCLECIIFRMTGNCQHLKSCETNRNYFHGNNLVEVLH